MSSAAAASDPPAPAPPPPQPSDACADLLSQMQFELHRMSELFLSTVGELQRDAGPVSINTEDLLSPASTSYDPEQRATGFATEVMQVFQNFQSMIAKLPTPPGTEQEQLDRIHALQLSNQQLTEDLIAQQQAAEGKLEQAQDLYALLARHELSQRHPTT